MGLIFPLLCCSDFTEVHSPGFVEHKSPYRQVYLLALPALEAHELPTSFDLELLRHQSMPSSCQCPAPGQEVLYCHNDNREVLGMTVQCTVLLPSLVP